MSLFVLTLKIRNVIRLTRLRTGKRAIPRFQRGVTRFFVTKDFPSLGVRKLIMIDVVSNLLVEGDLLYDVRTIFSLKRIDIILTTRRAHHPFRNDTRLMILPGHFFHCTRRGNTLILLSFRRAIANGSLGNLPRQHSQRTRFLYNIFRHRFYTLQSTF